VIPTHNATMTLPTALRFIETQKVQNTVHEFGEYSTPDVATMLQEIEIMSYSARHRLHTVALSEKDSGNNHVWQW